MLKKLFLLLTVFFCSFCCAHAQDNLLLPMYGSTAVFPKQLLVIDAEAFSGTSIGIVYFNDGLEILGDRAFADNDRLRFVYMPQSLRFIGSGAVPVKRDLLICGHAGSEAQEWALENGYVFISVGLIQVQDHWNRRIVEGKAYSNLLPLNDASVGEREVGISNHQSHRRKDRPEMDVPDALFP